MKREKVIKLIDSDAWSHEDTNNPVVDMLCKLSDEYCEQEYPRHPDVLYELLYKYVMDNKEKFE